jgi:VCBS repeat-containing protein
VAQSFSFKSTDLTTVNIEKLEVVVDGVALDPSNEPVTARNDSLSVTEDAGGGINLLGNDDVPDRAASVSLLSAASRGIAKLTPELSGAMQQAILSYTPSEALQSLRAGETATDQITYKAIDVNGDSSTATVAITISGVNDLAEILGKAPVTWRRIPSPRQPAS